MLQYPTAKWETVMAKHSGLVRAFLVPSVFHHCDRATSFFLLCFVVKNVEMAGWTAEDLAGRGCCSSLVTAAFFAWSFLFCVWEGEGEK
jgi:hypothetical protein